MRLLTVFLTILLISTACTAPVQPTVAPADISESESDRTALGSTFETSLLVTAWKGGSEGNELFPLDPVSGEALPGYPPISLGHTFSYAFSPDRQTLAVVSFPSEATYNGSLLLIDLPTWKTQSYEVGLNGWVTTMVFSPSGEQLAIVHGESSYKLTMVNIDDGVITAQSQTDSFVSRLKFTEGGEALMLYQPTINTENGLSAGPPQVLLLNVADLRPLWSAALDEVRDGIFPKDESVTPSNIYEPGRAFYFSPGLAFAPDRDVLYVVHADSERLTSVDFAAQMVETVDIEAKLTWFERLLSLTADVVHAKIGDGITRQAAISPDGEFLYVVGVNSATFQDKQGNWQMEQTSSGLEIIRTEDGSRVERIATDTTELSLAPDGRFLYLRNWGNNVENLPWTEIFDTSSRKLVARKDEVSAAPALLINGEFLLTSTFSTSEYSHHMSILEPDGSSVLADWTDSSYISWLTIP